MGTKLQKQNEFIYMLFLLLLRKYKFCNLLEAKSYPHLV